jgi:hypothetical protein
MLSYMAKSLHELIAKVGRIYKINGIVHFCTRFLGSLSIEGIRVLHL